jgi:hypothetical protein
MVTRPGSDPGPAWMRKFSDDAADLRQLRRTLRRIFIFIGIFQLSAILIGDIAVYQARGRHVQSYNSELHIAGLPLISIGRTAHGVIAYGGVATGIIAVGGLSIGVFAFGGLGVGLVSFGGLSLGVFATAGVAVGWRAIGGLAIGNAALGGLAIGRYAYAGNGVALGRDEASGKQKESLFG